MNKIPAFIISLDDDASRKATQKCIDSILTTKSYVQPFIFPAIDHWQAENEMYKRDLEWTYPVGVAREEYNMVLKPYETKVLNKRIGCALSHLSLWETISELNDYAYYMILEQDAMFTRAFSEDDAVYFEMVTDWEFICSLNSPIKATRKSTQFDLTLKQAAEREKEEYILEIEEEFREELQDALDEIEEDEFEFRHFDVPWVDDESIPQGLPGNSAYIITPQAAKRLVRGVNEIGLWPNDAYVCKQFFDDMMYSAYPYYTKVQGNKSTTSL